MSEPKLIVICGATATGKSDLSLAVAQELILSKKRVEIINADSMQLYQGMDIGTAKLSLVERSRIKHYLLDEVVVSQDLNVSWYQERARKIIDEKLSEGTNVIVVGGTGLYIKAILDDLDFPDTDLEIRNMWEAKAKEIGAFELHRILSEKDPAAAIAIPAQNIRRVVRALEVISITGKPFTARLPRAGSNKYPHALQFAIRIPRAELDERIETRTNKMFDSGFVEEVQTLIKNGLLQGRTAQSAIGYSHVIRALNGELNIEQAHELTNIATRQYARRQCTWFERDGRVNWLDGNNTAQKLNEVLSNN